jgi:hypothetical protein
MSASWVTISTVMPLLRLRVAPIRSMISRLRSVSRLPVGSSASSTGVPGDDGPGDGHALLLAAGELGRGVMPPSPPAPPPASAARAAPPPGVGSPRYSRGSSTFSRAVVRDSRLKPWKTKPR